MKQGFKEILLAIKIAEKKKKKLVLVSPTGFGFRFLNVLWDEGFIYGYSRNHSKVLVFLKSNLFSRLIFFNRKILSWQSVKILSAANKNNFFFIATTFGILPHSVCIKKKLGGVVIFCL